jgi:lantibiotic modifying enzyme
MELTGLSAASTFGAVLGRTVANGKRADYQALRQLPAPLSASVAYGAAGRALGLSQIAEVCQDTELFAAAHAWLELATERGRDESVFEAPAAGVTPAVTGRHSVLHREPGVAFARAIVALRAHDVIEANAAIEDLAVLAAAQHTFRDVSFGKAGLALAVCNLADMPQVGAAVNGLRENVHRCARGLYDVLIADPDVLHGADAVTREKARSIAHGSAGCVLALLRLSHVLGIKPDAEITESLVTLATSCAPASIPESPSTVQRRNAFMASWCNGAAGWVHLWAAAAISLKSDHYLGMMEAAAEHTWTSEEKGWTLCCGAAGRAYALLKAAQVSGDARWIERARAVVTRALTTPLRFWRPDSLFKGELGLAVVIADFEQPARATMPVFG